MPNNLTSLNGYTEAVRSLLDHPLTLRFPEPVLEIATKRTFAAGLSPIQAAIRICHEHGRLVTRQLVEADQRASDLAEFTIASRIDECVGLASDTGQDILGLLPDLRDFVRQPCFSDEFREMIANIATWHRIPEQRWVLGPVRQSQPDSAAA